MEDEVVMAVAVITDFMALTDDLPRRLRIGLYVHSGEKEGRPDMPLTQHVEYFRGIGFVRPVVKGQGHFALALHHVRDGKAQRYFADSNDRESPADGVDDDWLRGIEVKHSSSK